MRQLALDIECVPTTDPPDFDAPRDKWSTFALSVSVRTHADAEPETAVFVRRGDTDRALAQLVCAVANWIRDRQPLDVLVTFNGESFDLPILSGHIATIEERDPEFAAFARETLDIPHRDLFREIVDAQPEGVKWPSLDEALRERGIASDTTHLDGAVVSGALMPAIGARVLDPDKGLGEHERAALKKYSASDVTPLHALLDALDRERHADAEADAVLGTDR